MKSLIKSAWPQEMTTKSKGSKQPSSSALKGSREQDSSQGGDIAKMRFDIAHRKALRDRFRNFAKGN
jgi:hypothetical protein